MKCTIPEISWHNRDPVLTVDIQHSTNEGFYRLASGGTDSHVLIWHLKILQTGATSIEAVSDLTRHQKAVNVVRWSHSGQYLASGDDDANIIVWHQKSDDLAIMLDGDNDDKEKWSVLKVLRGHKEDIYDICWSPDSSKLLSGSVDNTAIIWDLNRGLNDTILTDHKGFVQGVTWDPLGQFVATLCSDRICRIFSETGKYVKARLKKGQLSVPESHVLHGQVVRFYHDDTLKSYFRRLTFSPDGNLIITPAGCIDAGPKNKKLFTSYIFTTASLNHPVAVLPSPGQYTIAARCCPILFQLRPDGPDPVIILPYRMVFAIATRSSVILYDTQQMAPFATISNIHYTRLTDITWSADGRLLAVSSTDGFCSLVTFEPSELGTEYVKEPEIINQESNEFLNETIEDIMDSSLNISVDEKKEKKSSFLEKWTKTAIVKNTQTSDANVGNNEEKSDVRESKEEKSESSDTITKTNKEFSSTKMENVDVIRLEIDNEKENKNKENVLSSQDEKDKIMKTPDSKTGNKSVTTKSASIKLPIKAQQNSLPAKPIAVRRKPRNETANAQMNITQFLTPPKILIPEKPNRKDKINLRAVVLIEDMNQSKKKSDIILDEDSSEDEIPQVVDLTEESQDMKLILEETQDYPSQKIGETEKMNIDDNEKINVNNSNDKINSSDVKISFENLKTKETEKMYLHNKEPLNEDSCNEKIYSSSLKEIKVEKNNENVQSQTSTRTNKTDIGANKLQNINKNNIEEVKSFNIGQSSSKIINDNSEISSEIVHDNINSSKLVHANEKNNEIQKNITEISNQQITHTEANCDKQNISTHSLEKSESKETDKQTQISNILSEPKNSPAKKRVALITLSSPKHKKKTF